MNTTTIRKAQDLKGGDVIAIRRSGRRYPQTLEVFDTAPLNGQQTCVRVITPSGVESIALLNDADVRCEG
jgi:NAD-dependent DNA ligase